MLKFKPETLPNLRVRNSSGLHADVGNKLLVALGFVLPFHFFQRIANELARGPKHPVTLGATVALEVLVLDPDQLAWHCPLSACENSSFELSTSRLGVCRIAPEASRPSHIRGRLSQFPPTFLVFALHARSRALIDSASRLQYHRWGIHRTM